ncbi:carboxymuconolactone decarboxylase family protein [Allorhizocola rhizosphaerae]|uniref:carboxymuconolactone decarboxylase family protein n=1 Tax=Allorhizocola rhizosphaerae TaxID=1872709 RepID=UPI000E3EB745|nr:carboxymuconolactone decarboxylase family protein [Allorhizocola rhizosphaerae]
MKERLVIKDLATKQYRAMIQFDDVVSGHSLPKPLVELIKLRASQLNGCFYCVDMHTKDAKQGGETDSRLHGLVVWREAPYYTDAERAAFAFTEAVTLIHDGHVPDDVWEWAAKHFTDTELAEMIMVLVAINSWNRICVSTRMQPTA